MIPTEEETAAALHAAGTTPDPAAIYDARETLLQQISQALQDSLPRIYAACQVPGPYSPDADAAGKRGLGNTVLAMMSRLDGGKQAAAQFADADNMTQQISALAALLRNGHGQAELDAFRKQWKDDRLVMDKWFGLQVSCAAPPDAVACAKKLTEHPDFDWKNPNRFRAVFGALAGNAAGFHRADGAGYDLLADWLIKLDPVNPQTTARVCTAFQTLSRYDADRQARMRAALDRILASPNVSGDVTEMVTRMLG
jgi:aminopeptidase N